MNNSIYKFLAKQLMNIAKLLTKIAFKFNPHIVLSSRNNHISLKGVEVIYDGNKDVNIYYSNLHNLNIRSANHINIKNSTIGPMCRIRAYDIKIDSETFINDQHKGIAEEKN